MWQKFPERADPTGLAVVCGPVSDALVVRDFDTVDAYDRWVRSYPDLAELLPTVRTGRGFHVYFTGDCDRIVPVESDGNHEGELRGAGIVLLPPSKHPTGAVYEWTVPLPDGPIPAVDAVKAGLLPGDLERLQSTARQAAPVQQRGRREPRKQSERKTTETTEDIAGERYHGDLSDKRLAEIVEATQPHAEGQRNRVVFELARTLKGEPDLCDADPRDLRPIVEAWHKLALPVIRTQPFEQTRIGFLKGWPKVKWPRGSGPIRQKSCGPLPQR